MSIFGNLKPIAKVQEWPEVYTHQPDQDTKQVMESEPEDRNFNIVAVIIVLFLVLLIGRLLSLQIIEGQHNLILANGNRIRLQSIPAPRGLILDSSGEPLLKNIAQYNLNLVPSNLPRKEDERVAVYNKLDTVTGLSKTDYIKKIDQSGLYSLTPITLASNISPDQAMVYQVKLQDLPGISVVPQPVRQYTDGAGLGHVLGYIGKISATQLKDSNGQYQPTDWIGKAGLESQYEDYLKGKDGQDELEVNASGQVKRVVSSQEPVQGNNLKLSLDLKLQQATYNALKDGITKAKVQKGVAIAFNPKDGSIYSFVSYPDYNPNSFISGNSKELNQIFTDPNQVLLNRAIAGNYPPGSTIKPTYATAALQQGTISAKTSMDTPPYINVGSYKFPDWKNHSGQLTDVKRAIAQSNDIFFYAIAGGYGNIKGLGVDNIDKYLAKFGFGSKTGIDLPGERTGFIPTPDWKKSTQSESWYIGDTYHVGIGQGALTVTPIELVSDLSALINGGTLVTPHLGEEIDSPDGKLIKKISPAPRATNLASQSNLNIVMAGMRETVAGDGSAQNIKNIKGLDGSDIQAAGKTGTAQTGANNEKAHAWFIGYAPYDNPKVGVVVLLEDGEDSFSYANPVAGQILQNFFRNDNPAAH